MPTPEFPEVLEKRLDDAMTLLQTAVVTLTVVADRSLISKEKIQTIVDDYRKLVHVVYPDMEETDDHSE